MGPPLIVVHDRATLAIAATELRSARWTVREGISDQNVARGNESRTVLTGSVGDSRSAQEALLAVLRGFGLLVHLTAGRDTGARFLDDLTRLGPVDLRPMAIQLTIDANDLELLRLLVGDATVTEASRQLHVSRRTANRRLESLRRIAGVATTAQLIANSQHLT